ncbi:DUF4258 domain-containing protein [Vibrio parahaemolyticus]|uniref:DUF4258 domain-containing protein n=2 Tax=Vibrio parahaemolyticus TaxID=670 RepID=UPI001122DB4E|nr:DUF4258 domain-containing protein [Vibrio parahaemolyticus]EJL6735015.1 hypothetical protein [Vibrio alginolyticus]TOA64660.1 hypothetical protein CGK24_05995 [Vibrio parahaemolyticus]
MSSQQFSNDFRSCLWNIHKRKCFYCKEPIQYVELEVDHVIPESLSQNDKEFEKVKADYGLVKDFDLFGHQNLAPSCNSCNSDKSDNLLPPGYVAIALSKIEKKIEELEECLSKEKQDRKLGALLVSIGRAIEKKTFTKAELTDALKKKGLIEFTSKNTLSVTSNEISEEKPESNLFEFDDIVLTRHALIEMKSRTIDYERVIHALNNGVSIGKVVHTKGANHYKIRTRDGLEVVYTIKDRTIMILTCFWRDKRSI